jgi:23S rRNA pseudouridine2457 synthase
MVSQFVSSHPQRLLGDLDFDFPEGTHAIGRLDEQSEGLLILTTDKTLTRRLLHPDRKHTRRYLVQVRWQISPEKIEQLSQGLDIVIKKRGVYRTQPCQVKLLETPGNLAVRENAVQEFIHHSWLEFILTEGKNRQIRKMCKAVRHSCSRLIRTHIDNLGLEDMQPGEVREMDREELFKKVLLL